MPDYDPVPSQRGGASRPPKKKKKKGSGLFGRIVRRFFLVLFTVIALILVAACLALNLIFNGPSPAARDVLTMSLLEPSGTKWIPGLFMDAETLDSIRTREDSNLTDEFSNTSEIVINKDAAISTGTDEWANSHDGIRFEAHSGDTYNAHIMIVRDPSKVYLGTSTENFSTSIPGTRIDDQIETDGAIAGVNAGAFFDNGTSDPSVGSVPEGLVYSKGACKWTTGSPPNGIKGFAGFNKDNILVVAQDNLSKAQAEELNIRDGCCFGPVLIMNGEINQEAYNSNSGWNPRTAVGQRKDGAVVFVCIDGRQAGSMGPTSSPSRIFKGHHGAGQMGVEQVTVENLDIVKVDEELNMIVVRGAIPGPKGGVVYIKNTVKNFKAKGAAANASINPQKASARTNPQKASARNR